MGPLACRSFPREAESPPRQSRVVPDEVQKLPSLLNVDIHDALASARRHCPFVRREPGT